ncbi:MAG: hypothetical protein ACRC7N_06040 [Clostridium sp.]
MWSEKRGFDDLRIFCLLPIVLNLFSNGRFYILNGDGKSLDGVNSINTFTIMSLVITFIFIFFNENKDINEEEKKELRKKMYGMKILTIPFIVYILFTIIIVRNISIIASSLIMLGGYMSLYKSRENSLVALMGLTDTQKAWREYQNGGEKEAEATLFWKIKPMATPHVSVPVGKRINNINYYNLIIIGVFFIAIKPNDLLGIFVFGGISLIELFYIADLIFGIFTETEGKCTGVVWKEQSRSHRTYYEIYVTDFKNRREIKFRVYDYCKYNEGDNIRVIHGGLSKRVIDSYLA